MPEVAAQTLNNFFFHFLNCIKRLSDGCIANAFVLHQKMRWSDARYSDAIIKMLNLISFLFLVFFFVQTNALRSCFLKLHCFCYHCCCDFVASPMKFKQFVVTLNATIAETMIRTSYQMIWSPWQHQNALEVLWLEPQEKNEDRNVLSLLMFRILHKQFGYIHSAHLIPCSFCSFLDSTI